MRIFALGVMFNITMIFAIEEYLRYGAVWQTYTESGYEYRLTVLGDSAILEWRGIDEESDLVQCEKKTLKLVMDSSGSILLDSLDTLLIAENVDDVMEHLGLKISASILAGHSRNQYRDVFYFPVDKEMNLAWNNFRGCIYTGKKGR